MDVRSHLCSVVTSIFTNQTSTSTRRIQKRWRTGDQAVTLTFPGAGENPDLEVDVAPDPDRAARGRIKKREARMERRRRKTKSVQCRAHHHRPPCSEKSLQSLILTMRSPLPNLTQGALPTSILAWVLLPWPCPWPWTLYWPFCLCCAVVALSMSDTLLRDCIVVMAAPPTA